jgi:hypothetical protein
MYKKIVMFMTTHNRLEYLLSLKCCMHLSLPTHMLRLIDHTLLDLGVIHLTVDLLGEEQAYKL